MFNHPNFGYIDPSLSDLFFGQSTKMLDQSFGSLVLFTIRAAPGNSAFSQAGVLKFQIHNAFLHIS